MNNKLNDKEESNFNDNRTEKRRVGDIGEEVACIFLKKKGYLVVDRNYLRKYGEIDIVAKKDKKLFFVEVKSATCSSREAVSAKWDSVPRVTDEYRPEENVHPWKLKRLRRVIQAYLLEKNVNYDWEFGVIVVNLNMKTRRAKVSFMENIVL